jgi:hypothetical protein
VSGHNLTEESRCFALKWSYFGELTARELTLHSAPSFGNGDYVINITWRLRYR